MAGDRAALAKAITLVESIRPDHRSEALGLLDAIVPHTGGATRVGISGPPGVGKSTLIEALGLLLIERDHRVAVLAIDPSSARSGGSILGDKTRMEQLGRADDAFIRPSPSGRTLGGIARHTREALLLCEAAGFDIVLVETVGVGQSETAVADVVDLFLLLAAPGGGDELQGVKRGIMELADVIAVNKADGDLEAAANATCTDYRNAAHLFRPRVPGIEVPVVLVSGLTGVGVRELWETITATAARLEPHLGTRRAEQAVAWMWQEFHEQVSERATRATDADELVAQVRTGEVSPASAAARLREALLGSD